MDNQQIGLLFIGAGFFLAGLALLLLVFFGGKR